jgi:hypothetical protein
MTGCFEEINFKAGLEARSGMPKAASEWTFLSFRQGLPLAPQGNF